MHYLDTNILVYAIVNQDEEKLQISQNLIQTLLLNNELLISPLSLQELSFTLSKLKLPNDLITKSFDFFSNFCHLSINKSVINKAFQIVQKTGNGRNINDV